MLGRRERIDCSGRSEGLSPSSGAALLQGHLSLRSRSGAAPAGTHQLVEAGCPQEETSPWGSSSVWKEGSSWRGLSFEPSRGMSVSP